jgi:hypothetical protein
VLARFMAGSIQLGCHNPWFPVMAITYPEPPGNPLSMVEFKSCAQPKVAGACTFGRFTHGSA